MDDSIIWTLQLENLINSIKFGHSIIECQYIGLDDAAIVFNNQGCSITSDFDNILSASIVIPLPQVRADILQIYAELYVDDPALFTGCWLSSPAQKACAAEVRAALEEQITYYREIAKANSEAHRKTDKLIA